MAPAGGAAVARTHESAPAHSAAYRLITLEQIVESSTNPRKRFDEASLAELTLSIQEQGIIEPLIVREQGRGYELVAGARRLRAASRAGLTEVPCLVRDLTDRQALELQITENLQRKDVHPLEEADGYAALQQADKAYTVEAVAARVGRSTDYVYKRLRLKALIPDARASFEREEITAAHAVKLARLSEADQAKALPECFYALFGGQSGDREVRPVKHLDDWISQHTAVDVTNREALQHDLPELHEQLAAVTAAAQEDPEAADPMASLLALSDSGMPTHYLGTKDHGLIGANSWKEVKSATACPHTKRGVIVHSVGGRPHRVLWVCAKKGCPKHWPAPTAKAKAAKSSPRVPTYDHEAENRKREEERKRFDVLQPRVLTAVAKTFADTKFNDALVRRVVESLSNADEDIEATMLAAGYRVGVAHAGPVFAFLLSFSRLWNVDQLRALAKAHKVDFKAIEKAVAADAKAEADAKAAAAPKATTKEPAKKSAKKAGRK